MKECAECKSAYSEGALTCQSCGAPLSETHDAAQTVRKQAKRMTRISIVAGCFIFFMMAFFYLLALMAK